MGVLDHDFLPHKYRGWACVMGGFIVQLTLGTLFSFGNMVPYITSYIRAYGSHSDLRYSDAVWLFALGYASEGLSVFLGGFLYTKLGARLTTLLGSWILSVGVLLTTVAIKSSFFVCIFTYGVMYGLGAGIAYALPLASSMRWLPNHKGLVNGIILAGYGAGAGLAKLAQTQLINPNNKSPSSPLAPNSTEKYFSPDDSAEVLARTPMSFLILGSVYAVMQLIGCMLIKDPPPQVVSVVDPNSNAVAAERENKSDNDQATLKSVEDELAIGPTEALKTRAFYTLWFTFFANGMSIFYITSLYKEYGQTFIHDDKFLTVLGATALACNACGRIVWGMILEKLSYRVTMSGLCASMMVLMATLLATPYGGKPMFFIWIILIFFIWAGNFVIFPTVTARLFGTKHLGMIYGLIYTSQGVIGIVGTVLTTMTTDSLGRSGMFGLVSGFSLLGLLLTLSFNMKTEDGRGV